MGIPHPPIQFQKFFVQDLFSSIHTSCVNFIKIAPLLKVSIHTSQKYRSMGGTPPPNRFQKFFVQDIFSSIHTSCGYFIKIVPFLSRKYRSMGGTPPPPADSPHLQYQPIPRQNTYFGVCFIKIGKDLLKLSWGQIWDTAYRVQGTAYSVHINNDPP